MEKKMRKIVALVMAMAVILSLAACGGNSAPETTAAPAAETEAAEPAAETEAPGTEAAEASDEPVLISILDYNTEGTLGAAMEEIQAKFTELHPNVSFEYIAMDSNDMLTVFQNRVVAGDAPNICQAKPRTIKQYIEAGYVMDLSEYDDLIGGINPDLLAETEVGGKYYGVPFDGQVKGVFYNVRMFEEAGVSVPTTWDEFVAVCDAFMDKGTYPFMVPLNGANTVFHFFDSYATVSAHVRGEDSIFTQSESGEIKLADSELAKEWFKILAKLTTYKAPDDGNRTQGDAVAGFGVGERPMMICGGWSVGDILAAAADAGSTDEFGFFPFPWSNNPEENLLWFGCDDVFIIGADCPNPEMTREYVKFLSSGEGQAIWTAAAKCYSAAADAAVDTSAYKHLADIDAYVSAGKVVSKADVPDDDGEALTTLKTAIHTFISEGKTEADIDQTLSDLDEELSYIAQ